MSLLANNGKQMKFTAIEKNFRYDHIGKRLPFIKTNVSLKTSCDCFGDVFFIMFTVFE